MAAPSPSLDPAAGGDDPLALLPEWPCPAPLLSFPEALSRSVAQAGLSRQEWLGRLARGLNRPALVPLLWLLPRGWRLAPAELPPRLRALAGVLERGLLTPTVLAALADDLPHLLPPPPAADTPTALRRWQDGDGTPPPTSLAALLALEAPGAAPERAGSVAPPRVQWSQLAGGLVWANQGLSHGQSALERQRNSRCAQALNRLGANLLGGEPWHLEGCRSAAELVALLERQGWQVWAQLRCGITSFGLGASLSAPAGAGWLQVPLALPMRTGLLDGGGGERLSLLPHCCLEMEWRRGSERVRLQFYQGTEGLCGWEGLNDLQRPWQNDQGNGTLRYFGGRYGRGLRGGAAGEAGDGGGGAAGGALCAVLHRCDALALVHNLEASERHLRHGGYGTLGLCIDSAALLQQSLEGRCQVFPVLLGGLWRERLARRCDRVLSTTVLSEQQREALEAYRGALAALPYDGFLRGAAAREALGRLRACQPLSSPFALVAAVAND